MEDVQFEPVDAPKALPPVADDKKVAMTRVAAIRAFFNMDTTRPIEPREIMTLKPEERVEIGDMCLKALGVSLLETT